MSCRTNATTVASGVSADMGKATTSAASFTGPEVSKMAAMHAYGSADISTKLRRMSRRRPRARRNRTRSTAPKTNQRARQKKRADVLQPPGNAAHCVDNYKTRGNGHAGRVRDPQQPWPSNQDRRVVGETSASPTIRDRHHRVGDVHERHEVARGMKVKDGEEQQRGEKRQLSKTSSQPAPRTGEHGDERRDRIERADAQHDAALSPPHKRLRCARQLQFAKPHARCHSHMYARAAIGYCSLDRLMNARARYSPARGLVMSSPSISTMLSGNRISG